MFKMKIDGRTYKVQPSVALKLYGLYLSKGFDVQVWLDDEFIVHAKPTEYCQCGEPYNSFRHKNRAARMNAQATAEYMRTPFLCKICYYNQEAAAGRWTPKNYLES